MTLPLPFGAARNSDLFSNHWLERRLSLEPEWTELRAESDTALAQVEALWRRERGRVSQYGNEAGLEQAFIQPIFEVLGWKLIYQTTLLNRRPDYALFLCDEHKDNALSAGRDTSGFWNHATIVADAKAWHISLDRPRRIGQKREYPPEQIESFLDKSRCDYGILTNGRLWRLVPRELSAGRGRFQTYFEIDLERLLETRASHAAGPGTIQADQATSEDFFLFYLFFGPRAFESTSGRATLVDRALRGSSEYALAVGEDLKLRVFEALRLSIEGFLSHRHNNLDARRDLELCREQSFVLLYRLLFIMYAEDRSLLPYRRNTLYTRNRSLARHRDEIADSLTRINDGRSPDFPPEQVTIWHDLVSLFDLIDRGGARYQVPRYNGGLFDKERHPFLAEREIPDTYLARVIDQLGRTVDPLRIPLGLFRVDYRDLAIQHLGSIYEGLLEMRPHIASETMIVIRRNRSTATDERVVARSQPVEEGWHPTGEHIAAGQVYLQTDKGERRATGSYYTPDSIVRYIVDNTLGSLCKIESETLAAEIAEAEAQLRRSRGAQRNAISATIERLRGEYDDRILRLRIVDPAMGSGHFLVRACQFLAEEIATNPHTSDLAANELLEEESILTYWKRRVVERCIFGVDLNPMAVELAKLALWLETVSINEPLSFLDHHLRAGNSLMGGRILELGSVPDAPPLFANTFQQQVEQQLPVLLEPLRRISSLPSHTADQIKEKEQLYRRTFQPLCEMFRSVADLWCFALLMADDDAVTPERYQRALASLRTPSAFRQLSAESWFRRATDYVRSTGVAAFHWELEFPEVFLDRSRLERDASFHRGFDAVIGNPPWGRAPLLDLLQSVPRFKSVDEDHAECFVCLGPELLAQNGQLGLVLPDTILSPAKSNIRRHMLTNLKSTGCYNIGPDWFTSSVRMSTVIYFATQRSASTDDYVFHTCVFPITIRRDCQAGRTTLPHSIELSKRLAVASECLADPECAFPLFGSAQAVRALKRASAGAVTLDELCIHARGVELNKAGEVFRCPHCGEWDAPPLRDRKGKFKQKCCLKCGISYQLASDAVPRVLVLPEPGNRGAWMPYVDGDCIRRYANPTHLWIDTSASGIKYKPSDYYESPKILIRQAGIGLGAVLEMQNAYCPQSVYIYHVKDEYKSRGIDEPLVLSFLCSRLLHLQVFVSFGEIDSSRAFAKLTHVRLGRLRMFDPEGLNRRPQLSARIRNAVHTLSREGTLNHEYEDWEIEACWAAILGLSIADVEAVIGEFAKIHENEALLALFPGGVAGREEYWNRAFRNAASRCGIEL